MAKTPGKALSPHKEAATFHGYEVLGVTKDGVRILKTRGKATHFTTKEIRKAVAAAKAARASKSA